MPIIQILEGWTHVKISKWAVWWGYQWVILYSRSEGWDQLASDSAYQVQIQSFGGISSFNVSYHLYMYHRVGRLYKFTSIRNNWINWRWSRDGSAKRYTNKINFVGITYHIHYSATRHNYILPNSSLLWICVVLANGRWGWNGSWMFVSTAAQLHCTTHFNHKLGRHYQWRHTPYLPHRMCFNFNSSTIGSIFVFKIFYCQ